MLDHAQTHPLSGRVYLARGPHGLEAGLAGSIHSEVLDFCGLTNVAASLGSQSLGQVSLEQLYAWQPQRIICQDRAQLEHIRANPAWQRLAAVQQGQVHLAPAQPFGWLDGPPASIAYWGYGGWRRYSSPNCDPTCQRKWRILRLVLWQAPQRHTS